MCAYVCACVCVCVCVCVCMCEYAINNHNEIKKLYSPFVIPTLLKY